VEKRRAAHKAQHKKRQIAKRDRNDNCNKRRKAGELGVSSDEDPSPEPSWSGDVASAAVDWSKYRGRPRRHPLAALKCRRRASRRRPSATRPWARAFDRRLAPPERTSGRSAPV
jgi:hypothetical protein